MTELTKQDTLFIWGLAQQTVFAELKESFTTAPILVWFDFERDTIMETDASDFGSAGILSRFDNHGTLHPVAYFRK